MTGWSLNYVIKKIAAYYYYYYYNNSVFNIVCIFLYYTSLLYDSMLHSYYSAKKAMLLSIFELGCLYTKTISENPEGNPWNSYPSLSPHHIKTLL